VKQSLAELDQEEAALRAHQGDIVTPPNPFDTAVGLFWFWSGTRPYMRARHDLTTTILNMRTGEAAQAALEHCLAMLRLCRGDNMGVRANVPALYLRLGRDQDAFDFIKWYFVKATSSYDWRNMSLPFLDLHGEDAFELFEEHAKKSMQLSFLVAMTLIKIRLMLDMVMLKAAVETVGHMSAEDKMALVKEEAMSDVLLSRPDILGLADYTETVTDLQQQVDKMYAIVKEKNKHFWPAILNPAPYANAVPGPYTFGSRGETVLAFRESWYSWAETEPAIQYIRAVIRDDLGNGAD
jgi:hypothetical protein